MVIEVLEMLGVKGDDESVEMVIVVNDYVVVLYPVCEALK